MRFSPIAMILKTKQIYGFFVESIFSADVSAGILAYAILKIVNGSDFDFVALLFFVFIAILPDLDMIPFLFFRKKLKYSSHRRIGHHPLIVIPLYSLMATYCSHYFFNIPLGYVFISCCLLLFFHFIHDSFSSIGLHWLSPFSWDYYRVTKWRVYRIQSHVLDAFFEERRRIRGSSSTLAEVVSRSEKLNKITIMFAVVSWVALLLSGCNNYQA
jgi:LexA-binding, inner membrane-associated putative hydrolase